MNVRYGNLADATLLTELGAKTFHDAYARQIDLEEIDAYISAHFSEDCQTGE